MEGERERALGTRLTSGGGGGGAGVVPISLTGYVTFNRAPKASGDEIAVCY